MLAALTDDRPRKKRRAAIACTACHARKVRCNVVLVGQPCSNCQQDQALCALHVSARGKHKRPRINRDKVHSSAISPALSASTAVAHVPLAASNNPLGSNDSISPQSDLSSQDEYESQANVEAYRNIVDATDTNEAKVPLYVGELQSLRFIFHVAREDKGISCKAHYLVPEPKRRQLSPEALAYLEAKDAFSTESEDLRDELLALFFDYIYPILPIVDPHDFYRRYDAGGVINVSPLLLQTMFLAASNFVSSDILKKSGYPSLMIMKRRFYERAKALYDFEYETDKICLIQSVLLLGYWLGNSQDRTDSWHWVGVAISLSQSVGIHRDPGFSRIPAPQRSLWRRIWWCCFYRDRCIALGMGRACRINLKDCDVEDLTLEDLICNSPSSSNILKDTSAAIVSRCSSYAPIFLEIVKLSKLLGDVLATVYRPRRKEDFPDLTSWSAAGSIEQKLTSLQLGLDPRCRVDMPMAFSANEPGAMILHKYYIQILHHVTVITLYKPFVFQGNFLPTHPESDVRARIAWESCQLSAYAATDCFRKLSEPDLIRYLPPEGVTMLISIIAILFLSKCLSTGMKWHLANQNLDLAMLVVQQLQEKYLAARFIFAYYMAAFEKVAPSQRPLLRPSSGSVPLPSTGDSASRLYEGAAAEVMSSSLYDEVGTFSSGQEDHLGTWADCFPADISADFDILFGEEGIMNGFDEFV